MAGLVPTLSCNRPGNGSPDGSFRAGQSIPACEARVAKRRGTPRLRLPDSRLTGSPYRLAALRLRRFVSFRTVLLKRSAERFLLRIRFPFQPTPTFTVSAPFGDRRRPVVAADGDPKPPGDAAANLVAAEVKKFLLGRRCRYLFVMAGLVPAIHALAVVRQ
jgi:hypothetical protein